MNRVVLIGRLTRDPELRFAAGSGTAVTNFALAVNRPRRKDGQSEADFINCVAFGKTAETIAQYLTKGRQLAISGSIRTGSYDAQDGTKRYTTDVYVDSFDFIDSGNGAGARSNSGGGNGGFGNSGYNAPKDDFGGASYDDDMTPIDDGDIPF
ncbi:single-strand binding protein [Clostridium amylolyticum]|uniref:Single-stranded DNA-binding protein n=1 Tax=Clostridium amylolyticum TaxID=1121298 RepID=A0A1M6FTH1_9CLOT|nr:single-stranded DNA-binding protein [Clostridium amylolyticum]SHJ00943.1 single-strand binding protein [Clostridium amylolyticum]